MTLQNSCIHDTKQVCHKEEADWHKGETGMLHPGERVWSSISMDFKPKFIGPLNM